MKHVLLICRLQHQQLAAAQLAHSRHSQNGGSKLSGSPRRGSETSHSPLAASDDDSDSSISLGVPSPGPPSLSLGSPSPTSNGLSLGPPTPPSSIGSILSPYTSVPPSLSLALHRPFSSPRLSWYSTIHPLVPGWWIVATFGKMFFFSILYYFYSISSFFCVIVLWYDCFPL